MPSTPQLPANPRSSKTHSNPPSSCRIYWRNISVTNPRIVLTERQILVLTAWRRTLQGQSSSLKSGSPPKSEVGGRTFPLTPNWYDLVWSDMESRQFHCLAENCGRSFTRKEHLTRHERSHNEANLQTCHVCHRKFNRRCVSASPSKNLNVLADLEQ